MRTLEQLRRGSLTDQVVTAHRKDGSVVRRGPYPLFTRKVHQQTLSQRLTDPSLVPIYRRQIQALHRFDDITRQLVNIGEQLSDLTVELEAQKKTPGGTGTGDRSAARLEGRHPRPNA